MTTSIERPPTTAPGGTVADLHADPARSRGAAALPGVDGPTVREPMSGDTLSLLVLGALAVVAGLLCYVAFQHTYGQDGPVAASPASSDQPGEVAGVPAAGAEVPAQGGAPQPARLPEVPDLVRADFLAGDPWPEAAGSRDDAAVSWPMGLVDGRFTHGPPQGEGAASWLERWLGGDVRALGAKVRFGSQRSGSVALTAWSSSVLEAPDGALPATGMRLVAAPGSWQLVAIEGEDTTVLADGSWTQSGRTATFELVRNGDRLWVVDPTGQVTRISDARAASLAGPYASWELREDEQAQQPAAFEEIWAG